MSSEFATDIRVDHHTRHSREVIIYDKYGGVGDISLTIAEAEFVRDRLNEVLE